MVVFASWEILWDNLFPVLADTGFFLYCQPADCYHHDRHRIRASSPRCAGRDPDIRLSTTCDDGDGTATGCSEYISAAQNISGKI